jgi:hypothetical protein
MKSSRGSYGAADKAPTSISWCTIVHRIPCKIKTSNTFLVSQLTTPHHGIPYVEGGLRRGPSHTHKTASAHRRSSAPVSMDGSHWSSVQTAGRNGSSASHHGRRREMGFGARRFFMEARARRRPITAPLVRQGLDPIKERTPEARGGAHPHAD